MKNRFKKNELKACIDTYAAYPEELARCVYTSRLIGSNSGLVLHGGGNTSVKLKSTDIFGEEIDIVYVKGSGSDLAAINPDDFTGLKLAPLQKLRRLDALSDMEMDNQLRTNKVLHTSPDPSVESLLHAFLPHKYVDHTHADSILALTNQKNGAAVVKEALGKKIAVIPYIMPGLPLAKDVMDTYESNPDIDAIVILNHGIFTFEEDAYQSYKQMVDYVSRAEAFISEKTRNKDIPSIYTITGSRQAYNSKTAQLSQVIRGVCAHRDSAGSLRRFYVETRNTPELIRASESKNAKIICASGVLTPDHATRTKNKMAYLKSPSEDNDILKKQVEKAIEDFKSDYQRYFHDQKNAKSIQCEMLDPYPRLLLAKGYGLFALGFTGKEARVAADIGVHNIQTKLLSMAMGEYDPVSESHIFDLEYWCLQQKKLDNRIPLPLQGQVAVVTGSAGAIGYGIADRLLASGACVAICDIDRPGLENVHSILAEKYGDDRVENFIFDVTDFDAVVNIFKEISCRFGGIDIMVPNAGIAHVATIEDLDPAKLDQVVSVNLKGTFLVIKACIPIFTRQETGGNIVVISSKNVFDPGAAFGAYSASKAGAHQIARIASLELAKLGVKVNMINPDAVFGDEKISSKLWDLIGPDRMKSRGLDADGLKEYYRQRNLLKTSVLAEHVGNAVVFFASDLTPTTGASLPVDGGNSAAAPR